MATSFNQRGEKITDGKVIMPRHILESLSSNGRTVYTATLWADGDTSCNCPGWASRKSCKHSKAAASITADVRITRDAGGTPIVVQAATGRRTGRIVE